MLLRIIRKLKAHWKLHHLVSELEEAEEDLRRAAIDLDEARRIYIQKQSRVIAFLEQHLDLHMKIAPSEVPTVRQIIDELEQDEE
jgi:hypothetical protein